jgi:hypothetical protein
MIVVSVVIQLHKIMQKYYFQLNDYSKIEYRRFFNYISFQLGKKVWVLKSPMFRLIFNKCVQTIFVDLFLLEFQGYSHGFT